MDPVLLKTSIITNNKASLPTQISRTLRRADEITNLCVAASYLTLNNYNDIITKYSTPEERSIVISTRFGPIETNFRYLDTIFDFGESQGSPTLFSHSVHNTASGYISRIFNFKGPIYTISSYSYPLIKALLTAITLLKQDLTKLVLIIETETKSNLLNNGIKDLLSIKDFSTFSYSIAWLLTNQTELVNNTGLVFNNISLEDLSSYKPIYNLFSDIILEYQNKIEYINSYQLSIKLSKYLEKSFYEDTENIYFKINSNIGIAKGEIYKYKKEVLQ